MPRLTNQQYLKTCRCLRQLWQEVPDHFAYIKAEQQWHLHDYFQPSKALSDAERLQHRVRISAERSSLPQRAGKALAKLYGAAVTRSVQAKYARGRGEIKVYGLANPEIDLEELVRVLLDIANDIDEADSPEPGRVEDHGPKAA
jgi:hypothetical protein